MLLEVEKYSFINAKIRGMKSRLFDGARYKQLMETTQLDAFVKALIDTDYGDTLLGLGSGEAEITEVTRAFDRSLIATYKTILKFFTSKKENTFIAHLISRLEVENLKIILRGKFKGISPVLISDALIPTNGLSNIDYDRLINSKDVDEFVSDLGSTRYGISLRQVLPLFVKDRRTVLLERPMDETYYFSMFENLKNLTGNDEKIMKGYIGTIIDCFNIMGTLRYRLYYDVPSDAVKSMIIPIRYRLAKTELESLTRATEEDYRDIINSSYYGRHVGSYGDLPELEMGLNRIMAASARKVLSGSPFNIGTIIGYLALKELEVGNLKCIAEGKRHNLAEDEISASLVM
ncbi:MAG: V-type ATPase subunit [Deltaproteobacteria bacterium]|uniref:V-type ATPase subunit n=1 Tax=Candidatus Zymogenus saltonus TaxID=2844893 RepID=A0A9D8KDE2_9DELT|nr:V-type ATPase subunit [Candidatus Zymogenus saltonus]